MPGDRGTGGHHCEPHLMCSLRWEGTYRNEQSQNYPAALLKPKVLWVVALPHSLAGAGVKTNACTHKALSCCIAEAPGCMQLFPDAFVKQENFTVFL